MRFSARSWAVGLACLAAGCDESGTAVHPADAGSPEASATADAGIDSAPADTGADVKAADVVQADGADGGLGDASAGDSGGGGLLALSVSPLELYPSFQPSVHDYAVRCSSGTNTLSVTMAAAPGAVAQVTAPTASPSAQLQTVQVAVTENQAVVVTASGSSSEPYWIRCLPHDFPRYSLTTYPENGAPTAGYYLLGTATAASPEGVYAMVLDGNATPVWYRSVPVSVIDVDLQPSGEISFMEGGGTFGSDPNSNWQLLQLSPWKTSTVKAVGSATDFHELQTLPNGDHYLTTYPLVTGVDLTGLGTLGSNESIADCVVQEVDSSGAVAWQWSALAHVDPVQETTVILQGNIEAKPVDDIFHCNSIDAYDATHVLVSIRHLSAVVLVDKTTGQIVWKLGGKPYSKDGAQLLAVTGDPETNFYEQHDARVLPGGNISLFDDHTGQQSGVARGVEYALDLTAGTATWVRDFRAPTNSAAMGSFREYSDGTLLAGWGLATANSLVMSEFNAKGKQLLQLAFTQGTASYRAVKVPLSALDIGALRATVAHP